MSLRSGLRAPERDLPNVALNRPAAQAGGGNAGFAVDGRTDGDFAGASVTHMGQDSHAWLDVDLGEKYPVDRIAVWNRTDAASHRLADYWVLLSEAPFAARGRVPRAGG